MARVKQTSRKSTGGKAPRQTKKKTEESIHRVRVQEPARAGVGCMYTFRGDPWPVSQWSASLTVRWVHFVHPGLFRKWGSQMLQAGVNLATATDASLSAVVTTALDRKLILTSMWGALLGLGHAHAVTQAFLQLLEPSGDSFDLDDLTKGDRMASSLQSPPLVMVEEELDNRPTLTHHVAHSWNNPVSFLLTAVSPFLSCDTLCCLASVSRSWKRLHVQLSPHMWRLQAYASWAGTYDRLLQYGDMFMMELDNDNNTTGASSAAAKASLTWRDVAILLWHNTRLASNFSGNSWFGQRSITQEQGAIPLSFLSTATNTQCAPVASSRAAAASSSPSSSKPRFGLAPWPPPSRAFAESHAAHKPLYIYSVALPVEPSEELPLVLTRNSGRPTDTQQTAGPCIPEFMVRNFPSTALIGSDGHGTIWQNSVDTKTSGLTRYDDRHNDSGREVVEVDADGTALLVMLERGVIRARERLSGRCVWQHESAVGELRCLAVYLAPTTQEQIIVSVDFPSMTLVGLNATSGRRVWTVASIWKLQANSPNQRLLLAPRVRLCLEGPLAVYSIYLDSGLRVWTTRLDSGRLLTPYHDGFNVMDALSVEEPDMETYTLSLAGGVAYASICSCMMDKGQQVVALDCLTNEVLFFADMGDENGQDCSSVIAPVVLGSCLYSFCYEQGRVHVLNAHTGEHLLGDNHTFDFDPHESFDVCARLPHIFAIHDTTLHAFFENVQSSVMGMFSLDVHTFKPLRCVELCSGAFTNWPPVYAKYEHSEEKESSQSPQLVQALGPLTGTHFYNSHDILPLWPSRDRGVWSTARVASVSPLVVCAGYHRNVDTRNPERLHDTQAVAFISEVPIPASFRAAHQEH